MLVCCRHRVSRMRTLQEQLGLFMGLDSHIPPTYPSPQSQCGGNTCQCLRQSNLTKQRGPHRCSKQIHNQLPWSQPPRQLSAYPSKGCCWTRFWNSRPDMTGEARLQATLTTQQSPALSRRGHSPATMRQMCASLSGAAAVCWAHFRCAVGGTLACELARGAPMRASPARCALRRPGRAGPSRGRTTPLRSSPARPDCDGGRKSRYPLDCGEPPIERRCRLAVIMAISSSRTLRPCEHRPARAS